MMLRLVLLALLSASCGSRNDPPPVRIDGGGDDVSDLIAPNLPAGSCLLEYNEGLVVSGASPCCWRSGGANACSTRTTCNSRTGPGCCVIYSTGSTTIGGGCCYFEGGGRPVGADRAAACARLLAAPRL